MFDSGDGDGLDALDLAAAVGLAESLIDDNRFKEFDSIETLFNQEEEKKPKEKVSLKKEDNKTKIPAFEQMVMRKCGL